jgi:hypothetical protein
MWIRRFNTEPRFQIFDMKWGSDYNSQSPVRNKHCSTVICYQTICWCYRNCSQINCVRVLNKSGQSKIVGNLNPMSSKRVRVRSHQCSVSYWHFCLGSAALRKLNAYTLFCAKQTTSARVSSFWCSWRNILTSWYHDILWVACGVAHTNWFKPSGRGQEPNGGSVQRGVPVLHNKLAGIYECEQP